MYYLKSGYNYAYNKINNLIYGNDFKANGAAIQSKNSLALNKLKEPLSEPQLQSQTLGSLPELLKLFNEHKKDSESSDSALKIFAKAIYFIFRNVDFVARNKSSDIRCLLTLRTQINNFALEVAKTVSQKMLIAYEQQTIKPPIEFEKIAEYYRLYIDMERNVKRQEFYEFLLDCSKALTKHITALNKNYNIPEQNRIYIASDCYDKKVLEDFLETEAKHYDISIADLVLKLSNDKNTKLMIDSILDILPDECVYYHDEIDLTNYSNHITSLANLKPQINNETGQEKTKSLFTKLTEHASLFLNFLSNNKTIILLLMPILSATKQSQQRRSVITGIPGYKWTDEFQVNSYTNDDQGYRGLAVTTLSENKFIVAWNSNGQDGSGYGVYWRVFNVTGHALTLEFQANTYTSSGQENPAISSLSKDRFVVLWESWNQDGEYNGVYGHIFNITGNPLSSEFQVNIYTNSYQRNAAVSSLSEDKFVVAWSSAWQDGSGDGIYVRLYNAKGNPLTSELQVNIYTNSEQEYPAIISLSEDRFVVVWGSNGQDGSNSGIYGRIFNSTGYNPLTSEFRVNAYTTANQILPAVSSLSEDKFVVVWSSQFQDGSSYGVYGQVFNSSTGYGITSEFQVNSYTPNDQGYWGPAVSALPKNKFVVVWGSDGQGGGSYGVYGRIFNSTGYAITSEFQIDSYTSGDQGYRGLAVSTLPDKKFVVVWNSFGQDGSGYGVYGRVFTANTCPVLLNNQLAIKKGETVTINNNMLLTNDTDDSAADLIIMARNALHGYFERTAQPSTIINYFTQQEITSNTIRFVHDGTNDAPSYEVSVSDGFCETPWFNASITFSARGDYTSLIIGGSIGLALICTATAITAAGICVSKKRKQLKAKEEEVKLMETKLEETKFELGNFLKDYKIEHKNVEMLEHLGSGGEATVYKAKWEGKDVAYKIFKAVEQEDVKSFEEEAKIMLKSNHPNIIRVHGVCVKQGTFGILMEFMEMGSLHDVLKKKSVTLDWKSKWNIAYDVARAIKFLHSKDIVHRDIKTDNVLLYKGTDKIRAKIADFGMSKDKLDETATMAIGTYKYMAPEMTVVDDKYEIGKFPLKPIDIYALGMTYVALTIEHEPYLEKRSSLRIPAQVASGKLKQKLPKGKGHFLFFNLTNRCREIEAEKRPTADKIVGELEGIKDHVINFKPQ